MSDEDLSREDLIEELKRLRKRPDEEEEPGTRASRAELLTNNEEILQTALSNSPTVIFTQDKDLRYTWVHSPRHGYSNVLGKTDEELMPADYSYRLTEIKRQVLITGISGREEVKTYAEGHPAYYDLFIHPNFDQDGNITGLTGIATDISERKQTELALIKSEREKSLILESIGDAFCSFDNQLRFKYVNKAAEIMLNRPREQLLGRPAGEVLEGARPLFIALYQKAIHEKKALHYENLSNIINRWLDVRVFPFQDGICAYFRDIHERKIQEYEYQQQASLLDFAHDAILVSDLNNCITYWNKGSEKMYGWSKHEAIGKMTHELLNTVFPDSFESTRKVLFGTGAWEGELTHTTKNGAKVIVSSRLVLKQDENDNPKAILEINRDITERKYSEEALRQSEERFYKAFQSSPTVMAIMNKLNHRYLDVNESWLKAFGLTREQVIGHTATELNLFYNQGELNAIGSGMVGTNNYEIIFRTSKGERRIALGSSELVYMDGIPCWIHTMTDITDKRNLEKELARLDRLNLIGEMAASIGHEIRNPMTSIRGFMQLLKNKKEYKDDQIYFDLMIEELDRANQIISEYLGMAKDKVVNLKPKYLDQVVKSLYPVIMSDANRLEINVALDLNKPPVPLIDEGEIRQLIMNMVRNGLEAMSAGGTLTIRTTVDKSDVILSITDEGSGISPEVINKLGTPFITTKDNGTGLGLAVCYSIAARHNARIDYVTGLAGTTFYVRFPIPLQQSLLF